MRTLGLLALLAALGSCRALPEIAANTCGNHAIEAGEDCDGFARFGAECRPPGAVGECHLDCSAGDEGSPQCPEGFGCDLDGVCRRPSGEYDDRRSPIPGSAVELLSGDFDGDGRDDLIARGMPGYLGFSSFSIHYFDQRGALEDSWTTTQLFGASAVTSLSAEEPARSDLLFSVGAFGAMLGEANRTLTPLAYPAYYLEGARVVVLPIWDRGATESSPLLVIRELGTTLELEHPTTGHSAERLVTMGSIDGTLGALAGKPATGPLFEPKQSTCDALGLAFTDQDSVSLYELCQIADGDLNWLEDARVTQLPFEPALTEKGERVVVESGPIFADLDGDGHLDVLVMTNDGPHAALGNGEEFASLEPFRAYPEQNQQADVGENGFDISPIAAGDLTGDGIADLVDPEWLYVSIVEDGAIRYRKLQKSPGEPWEQGLVADLNADGKLDAITVTKRTPGIKFFMGTGSTRVNAFTIPTPYPAEHLTVGDIDGDGISDLAFAMLGRGPSGDDQISVAYGAPAGVPEDPVPVAHASNVSHVSALSDNLEDARADLLVVSDLSVNGGPHASTMSILIGTGDRGLFFSPMVLNTFATDGSLVEDTCVSMTAGHFVDPDKLDVMAVGAWSPESNPPSIDFHLWMFPEFTSGLSSARKLGWEFDARLLPLQPEPNFELAIRLAAGDLDGNGLDEIVLAAPVGETNCMLTWAGLTEDGTRLGTVREVSFDEVCSREPPLALRDLDGDGATDIVLITGARIRVLWNDGYGDFSLENATLIADAAAVSAFTLFQVTPKSPLELAYTTESEVRLGSLGRERAFAERIRLAGSFTGLSGIAAGDVDGDGVVDLAVADEGSVRVLRARLESR